MNKHTLICLLGESGSGKSTVANQLVEWGYKSIPSYTTRPMRDGEVNGKDHTFITQEEFLKQDIKCSTYFDKHYYGADKAMILSNDLYVVDCKGAIELKVNMPEINVIPIYIYVPESIRIKFMRKRGDTDEQIYRRIRNDSLMFEGINEICDYKVFNNDVKSAAKIVDFIYAIESHSRGRMK